MYLFFSKTTFFNNSKDLSLKNKFFNIFFSFTFFNADKRKGKSLSKILNKIKYFKIFLLLFLLISSLSVERKSKIFVLSNLHAQILLYA